MRYVLVALTAVGLEESVKLHTLCGEGAKPWTDLSARAARDPGDKGLRREAERENLRVSDEVFAVLVRLKTLLHLPDEVLAFHPVAAPEATPPAPEPAERATPSAPERPVAKTIVNALPSERGSLRSGTVAGPRPW